MTIDEAIDYLDCGTCGADCESCTGNRKHGGKCDVEKNLREAVDMAIVALGAQKNVENKQIGHGKWIKRKTWQKFVCSECSYESDAAYRYCPWCGASMGGDE